MVSLLLFMLSNVLFGRLSVVVNLATSLICRTHDDQSDATNALSVHKPERQSSMERRGAGKSLQARQSDWVSQHDCFLAHFVFVPPLRFP